MARKVRLVQVGVTAQPTIIGFGGGGTLTVKNLGPTTVYLCQGNTDDGAAISASNAYPLAPGETVQVPDHQGQNINRIFVGKLSDTATSSQVAVIGYEEVTS